ncbi:MAG: 50S ribosomal protein L3 N(5)-glutamine methyltransferase [Opitutus sp.]|nr:50S ribosomal protein L3 N(5)-glutamine methyltransferase [Opitutus sp.]
MPARPQTIAGWLDWAVRAYARKKVSLGQVADNAHDEALYLLLRTLELPLESPRSVLRRKVTSEQAARVAEIFRRRLDERVPAAYLTREAFLGGHKFYVDERVIIPRSYFVELLPEIAELLEDTVRSPGCASRSAPARGVKRVVDVCTGSGCLAVLLAHQFPTAKVDAIELSPAAAAVARFNLAQHGLGDRVTLHRSDVFDAVKPARYDLILSNPPYVPTREMRDLPDEFRREPAMALDGGRDGLDIVRKLLRQARERLQPRGIVALEVGQARPALEKSFPELEPHWLHTQDGEDCVCLIPAARLKSWNG